MNVALWGGLLLAVGAWSETRLLPRWRPSPWFAVGVPLPSGPAPVPARPAGGGRTASVRWEVVGESVRFWADPGDRTAPAGLRGRIVFRPQGRGVGMQVWWAPPLTLVAAPIWLAALAASRGDGPLLGGVAAVFLLFGAAWYARAARRAAGELREAFRQGCGAARASV